MYFEGDIPERLNKYTEVRKMLQMPRPVGGGFTLLIGEN
jgi:hypothetical protein